ncbi:MAG: tRNA dihydrouridine synthase DusB [Alphaproteobacteria bacterium]|nr:tRNA dihydrouridine synthase DusB [Alphaproteobacteria bacterium]
MSKNAQNLANPVIRIGKVELAGRAILAPMSGISDIGMRRAAMEFGASMVVSEMVACDAYVNGKQEARLRAEGQGVYPHVVQIAGCDPHWMAEAARMVEAAGADIIDINMGCPSKRVNGRQSGSALMRDLDHAIALIAATVAAVAVPVTVKMRLGWDDASHNAAELARRAQAAGAAMITVHGRTRCQFYTGQADWTAIRAVREAISVPLVANGDCKSADDARAILAASGADAVMIGRAALGQPWLAGEIAAALEGGQSALPKPPLSLIRRRDAALAHFDSLIETLGTHSGLRHARKHLAAYADLAAGPDAPGRRELVTSEDAREVRTLLASFFAMEKLHEAA